MSNELMQRCNKLHRQTEIDSTEICLRHFKGRAFQNVYKGRQRNARRCHCYSRCPVPLLFSALFISFLADGRSPAAMRICAWHIHINSRNTQRVNQTVRQLDRQHATPPVKERIPDRCAASCEIGRLEEILKNYEKCEMQWNESGSLWFYSFFFLYAS